MHLQLNTLEAGDARVPLVNLVSLQIETGDERQADELVDMLLRVGRPRIGAVHHRTAIALLELAASAFGLFRLGLAERLATRALSLLEVTDGQRGEQTLRAVQLLANIHNAKGNYEVAEQGLMHALDAVGDDRHKSAELMIDFGKALRSRGTGTAPAAAAMFERAIAQLRAQGRSPERRDLPLLASAFGNLALLHADLDDSPRAEAVYDEALRGLQSALRLWTRQRGASHPFVATVHANVALVHWARGDHIAAQRAMDRAAQSQALEVQRVLLVGTERQRLEAARGTLGDLFKRISLCLQAGSRGANARGAAQLLLQRKGAVLDTLALTHAHLRERLNETERACFDQLVELRHRIADKAIGASAFGEASDPREVIAWQAEEERLQSELSHAGALGLELLQPVTLQAVRAALPTSAVLLEFVRWSVFDPLRTGHGTPWRGQRYAVMVLRPRGDPHWFDVGEATVLDAATAKLHGLLRDPNSDPGDVAEAGTEVYQHIIAPIEPLLTGCSMLYIAPDGELNSLPFGVLGNSGGPILLERFVVNHVASGRNLMRSGRLPEAGAEVHAFVDADYDAGVAASGALQLPPLPGTCKEAAALQAHFTHCTVHSGTEASVEALRALHRPALLHIATHGLFAPAEGKARPVTRTDTLILGNELFFFQSASPAAIDNPMLGAGLALAGANATVPGQPVGFISAAELAGLDLQGTELVVLSACETGLGVAAHGDEFAGLRRAFTIAGAQSQVVSLWAVDDDAAAALMGEYYRLLAAGVGRAEALGRAQAAVRRRPRFAHPSAWAAFAAWGQAGPLSASLRESATEAPR